ncbi:MAG: DUF5666 domain-containing protein [Acidobacteriota bacterium]|nr:DUF5666 domain-containing protein [Acidobacteriota bacterium]
MKELSAAVFALLLTSACGMLNNGSSYPSGSSYPTNTTSEIRGTVDSVDVNSRSIYLTNVSNYSSNLYPNGSGNNGNGNVRVYYDDRTTVSYNGTNHRPTDLERGDQVSVRVDRSSNQLLAQSMEVLYNSRGSQASSGSTPYGVSSVHGTVRSIDTYARSISVDPGYGSYMTINYASNTPVYYNSRTYAISELRAGDQIDARVSDLGGGRFNAQDITVTRNGSGGGGTYGSQVSTIRGTVRYVDPSTRTISIDNATSISGFQTNPGSAMTIQYDSSAQVNYQGQLHPVTNLERGDVIDVQLQQLSAGNYLAQNITLVHDVNAR